MTIGVATATMIRLFDGKSGRRSSFTAAEHAAMSKRRLFAHKAGKRWGVDLTKFSSAFVRRKALISVYRHELVIKMYDRPFDIVDILNFRSLLINYAIPPSSDWLRSTTISFKWVVWRALSAAGPRAGS